MSYLYITDSKFFEISIEIVAFDETIATGEVVVVVVGGTPVIGGLIVTLSHSE